MISIERLAVKYEPNQAPSPVHISHVKTQKLNRLVVCNDVYGVSVGYDLVFGG